jgi:hypothetical protein
MPYVTGSTDFSQVSPALATQSEKSLTVIRRSSVKLRLLTLPFTNVFELDGELISHYKIYIDIAPLYAE